jgi:signal transduction histidine kinase
MDFPVLTSSFGTALILTPYTLLYLVPALIAAELALYGWQRRQFNAAVPFSMLMAAIAFWSICHTLSAASSTFASTLFWAQLQYGGIVLVAPLWLLFALAYHGTQSQIGLGQRSVLLLPAALSYAAVLTNDWHHLWWPMVALDTSRPFGSLNITRGVLFWLHYAYSYSCIGLGYLLIVHRIFLAPLVQRRQARLVALGALFPLAGNLAHILGMRTAAMDDPTPFLFVASGLVLFYAALRYQFPDVAPIAPQELFASIPDGLVVLDQYGVVRALNDSVPRLMNLPAQACDWIGRAFQRMIVGSPLEIDLRALLTWPDIPATHRIAYEVEQDLRAVELRLRPLYAEAVGAGVLLMMRDRSERARLEHVTDQRLRELTTLNRMARAANAASSVDDLVWAIARELMLVIPGDRIVIGLLYSNDATVHLVVDEPLAVAPSLERHQMGVSDFALLEGILRTGQTQLINVSESFLLGTSTQTLLQEQGMRNVLLMPLVSPAEPLGAMFVGYRGKHAITPDEVRLCETLGELVKEAIMRARVSGTEGIATSESRFLAKFTHELRTPLTSLIGWADLLNRGLYGELPERAHEPLAYMRRNGQTLLHLINDILDFAKIEAGRFTIERSAVDLAAVIHDVVGAMQPLVQERGLTLEIDIAAGLPLVYAHRERLGQVLTNLVANAIKFTDAGVILVRATADADRVRFSVMDSGIGIAPEQQRVIFEEFQQIASENQVYYPGTGLGLPISKRLMALMDGTLTVESIPGVGSTFYGEVPIVSEHLREQEHGATPQ